jgi:hypothetical protein
MPDRARRVVPPEPDPAELVHRSAVHRVQGQGLLLMDTRTGQVAAGQAHLAGQEMHIGLVRRQLTCLGRGGVGDAEVLAGQGRLRHADVRLPQVRCQAAGLAGRPQRVSVVTQVDQRVAGQPVRPLVLRVECDRPVSRAGRVGVSLGAQVSAGQQAPGPAVVTIGGHHPGQQRGGLVATPDIEHRRRSRQLLPDPGGGCHSSLRLRR